MYPYIVRVVLATGPQKDLQSHECMEGCLARAMSGAFLYGQPVPTAPRCISGTGVYLLRPSATPLTCELLEEPSVLPLQLQALHTCYLEETKRLKKWWRARVVLTPPSFFPSDTCSRSVINDLKLILSGRNIKFTCQKNYR